MRFLTLTAAAMLLLPAWACAQKLNLNFPELAAKATEKAEVDLDGAALAQARQVAGSVSNPQAKAAADASAGITGVVVRHYTFAEAGAYPQGEIDALRKKVAANPAWGRLLSVRENQENTEIFMMPPSNDVKTGAFLLISTQAKEVTVVQILGTVELGQLKELVNSSIKYNLQAAAEK